MKCPACDGDLVKIEVGDIAVDACKGGCGGLWFDRFELDKVDEPHEEAGIGLLDLERDPSIEVDHETRRVCPKCDDLTLMRHFFDVKRRVEVDECPGCAGIWLDTGELAAVRTQYASEEERRAAVDKEFDDLLGDTFAEMKAESRARLESARRIARMLRFVCPSYHIPGKQRWGAF